MNKPGFPRTLLQAVKYFADLDVARGFLAHLRWPDGITCPSCQSQVEHRRSDDLPIPEKVYRCPRCRLNLIFDQPSQNMKVVSLKADVPARERRQSSRD